MAKKQNDLLDGATDFESPRYPIWVDKLPPALAKRVTDTVDAYLAGELPNFRTRNMFAKWMQTAVGVSVSRFTVLRFIEQREALRGRTT
jgi:hypothetical protein